ncbi:DUF3472 domain-containing protein [Sphingobacterium sp. 1.A.4]|uniref:DUF3472 domain-containing protein n=1 Tax=Sphingobacterium sp. 1.A.4 TaxID=2044603 RepID=UPI000C0BE91A|nr:DUF3472 domain-containing protein [Sphingobacterium sp. 1.A.4]
MKKTPLKFIGIMLFHLALISSISCSKTTAGTDPAPNKPLPVEDPKPTTVSHQGSKFQIPLAGNSFVTSPASGYAENIHNPNGLKNWNSANSIISTYVRFKTAGKIVLSLNARTLNSGESSEAEISINNKKVKINLTESTLKEIMVGEFDVPAGYVKIDLQGTKKSGSNFGEVSEMTISGSATAAGLVYSNKASFYYWARRGPSCHLQYTIPTTESVSYFYSEVMVPTGEDAQGSYFMANGFAEGYFGFQVNSPTKRRILFSVWSPYNTDNPNDIPADQRITLNKKGSDVYTGEFGNEGSGGQSYLKYNWKAGTTYRFLLKGEPDGTGKTDYTAWFYTPETEKWNLIASFKRPKTNTYLRSFHSFLENFNPSYGHQGRQAHYQNQWVRTTAGTWLKVSEATFTVDDTYNNQQRVDAMGGTNANGFFLRNCGFFNDYVAPGKKFSYMNQKTAPSIDFTKLP